MKTFMNVLLALTIVAVGFYGCKEENDGSPILNTSTINVFLTDAPATYDSVLIDVQGVMITGPAATEISLSITPGIYNLLDFTNGVDTLLATGTINAGTISQIRLILGNNNRVVVSGVSHPLSTPSAQQSGLKLQIHKALVPGVTYNLLLDFDAQQSIVEQGNGNYSLKPVIRVIEIALGGSIKGTITPVVNCLVAAQNSTDTFSTYCDANGSFLLQGIPAGTYDVVFTPASPLLQQSVQNVSVTTGAITDLGLINL